MTSASRATISFGVQAGDEIAGNTVEPHFMALRRLLATRCIGPYSDVIREFDPILRIDGSIGFWNKQGCGYFRIQKKSGYATFDIFMQEDIWKDGNSTRIRNYLMRNLKTGVEELLRRATKSGVVIDGQSLLKDLDLVKNEFLDKPCS